MPTRPAAATPSKTPMAIPAFWPPVRPVDEAGELSSFRAGSGLLGVGEGGRGGGKELLDGGGEERAAGGVSDELGPGVPEAGALGELGVIGPGLGPGLGFGGGVGGGLGSEPGGGAAGGGFPLEGGGALGGDGGGFGGIGKKGGVGDGEELG